MQAFSQIHRGRPPVLSVADSVLRMLPSGVWAAFFTTGGPDVPRKDNCVAVCFSDDEGATWSTPETVIAFENHAARLCDVIVTERGITLWLASHDGRYGQWGLWSLFSEVNARQWSAPERFDPLPRRGLIRGGQVVNRRCLQPYLTYDVRDDPRPAPQADKSFEEGLNGVLISDDAGETWRRSNLVGPTSGWCDATLAPMPGSTADHPQRLVMLIRSDHDGELKRCESFDAGYSWTQPTLCGIPNASQRPRLMTLPDGRLALLHHPDLRPDGSTPLHLWVSDDPELRHWSHQSCPVPFPGRLRNPDGFVHPDGDRLCLAFDYNGHDLLYASIALPD